jgi:hypothetical protein
MVLILNREPVVEEETGFVIWGTGDETADLCKELKEGFWAIIDLGDELRRNSSKAFYSNPFSV